MPCWLGGAGLVTGPLKSPVEGYVSRPVERFIHQSVDGPSLPPCETRHDRSADAPRRLVRCAERRAASSSAGVIETRAILINRANQTPCEVDWRCLPLSAGSRSGHRARMQHWVASRKHDLCE